MATQIKTFPARERVFIFSGRSATGYVVQTVAFTAEVAIVPPPATYGIADITAGAVQVSIVHGFNDSTYGFIVLPTWGTTTVWQMSTDANQVDFLFSTPAPSGGQIYWEGLVNMPSATVTAGSTSYAITHSANDATKPIFVTPSWNTTVWDYVPSRTADTATVYFSTPAPVGDGTIRWKTAT